jgi:phosphoribosylamine---glycine ligase
MLRSMHILIEDAFGAAGAAVIVEEFLEGEEASFFALVNGTTMVPLASAQDHKAAFDGDAGPNTGGMGAYSPAPVVTPELAETIMDRIMWPTIRGMAAEGRPYTGLLYAGVMITQDGPKTPGVQRPLRRSRVPAADHADEVRCAGGAGRLPRGPAGPAGARMARRRGADRGDGDQGIPRPYPKGSVIRGLERAGALDDVEVFHAGTAVSEGACVASGGRVLGVTARGPSVAAAQRRAYEAVDLIDWPEGFCRRDIGWRAIAKDRI